MAELARVSGRSARGRRRRAETPSERSDAAARFTSTRRARQRAGAKRSWPIRSSVPAKQYLKKARSGSEIPASGGLLFRLAPISQAEERRRRH